MRFLKEVNIILFCIFVLFCFAGTAAAADVITKTGNDYIIILDPNMTDDGTNVTNSDGTVIYSDMIISGSVYLYDGPYNGTNFSLAFDLFPTPTSPVIQLSVLDAAATENITINLIGRYNDTTMPNTDFINLVILSPTDPNRITLNGNNYEINGRGVYFFGGFTSPEIVEIRNLNISNGNLILLAVSSNLTNRVTISNSKINNGMVDCSNVSSFSLSITNVTVSNVTSGTDLIVLRDVSAPLIMTNTTIENGSLNSRTPSGVGLGSRNISITNLTLTDGNLNISETNDTISNISVINSKINGSFNLNDVNVADNNTSNIFINVTNLTLTNGQMNFSDMIVSAINVTRSTVTNGQFNISNTSVHRNGGSNAPYNSVSITNSNFSNSAPGPELIVLNFLGDGIILNNKLTNGSLNINQFGASLNVTGNTISNTSHVLIIGASFGGFDFRDIYNNKFVVDSGNNYILLDPTRYAFDLNITPASGNGLTGGPYVAGNYWSTSIGNGYSDGLAGNDKGYSTSSFNVPTTGPVTEIFTDYYPLTEYIPPQGNPGKPNFPNENEEPPMNDPPENLTDPNSTTPDPTNERQSISDIFRTLKNNNATTTEVIMGYIAPASVIMGALVSALLLLIVSLIDLFFDITSEQVRKLAKEKTKYKLKFNPPKLSDIFKVQTAYMILLFIIGVCFIDLVLNKMTYAALEAGLLAFLVVIIPPIVIVALVNIGGGLFLDEVVSYLLRKTGKIVRRNTSILDIIEQKKNINVIAFLAIMFFAVGIVTFVTLFFGWTLI